MLRSSSPSRLFRGKEGRKGRRRSTPDRNPQNVPDPDVMPSVDLSPSDSVASQLRALMRVNHPRMDHGIQVMYVFANDGGGMERSRYFGYSKDIYHFDHFLGGFRNAFPDLLELEGFEIVGEERREAEKAVVTASIVGKDGRDVGKYVFLLGLRAYGTLKGCWLTDQILKVE